MRFAKIVFAAILTLSLIAACGAPETPVPQPLFVDSRPASGSHNYVNLSIDEIKILGDTKDPVGMGEFRLIVIGADTQGKSSGTYCPGDDPIAVHTGDVIKAPCLFVVSFDEKSVGDGVFLMLIAVDEDESNMIGDLSYELITNQLGSALGKAVTFKILGAAAESHPYAIAASVLVSYLGGKVKSWVENADTIGSQGIYLSRADNWSAGKETSVVSNDGGIAVKYTVSKTSDNDPPSPIPPPTPTDTPAPPQVAGNILQTNSEKVKATRPSKTDLNTLSSIWDINNITSLDLASPGIRSYQVSVTPTDELLWAYYWCTSTDEILEGNLNYLTLEFKIDDIVLPDHLLYSFYEGSSDWKCQNWDVVLGDWRSGEVVQLDIRYVFSEEVHDGYNIYPAGEYIYRLKVTVR